MTSQEIRTLDIDDLERITRFRRAGYGGSVWDSLNALGVRDAILSEEFRPLRDGMQLVGRALTVRLHSLPKGGTLTEDDTYWQDHGGHPQKRMMRAVADQPDGTVLVFDCSGDRQASHFGEMSCQLAYAQGCRGMLIAGACRDTQYVMRMPDFPMFSYGARPHSPGGVLIRDVNEPIFLRGHMTHYVTVNPGDFVFGDNDGVQIIPRALVDEVLLRVEAIFETENHEREMLAAGMPIEEVYREYGVL